MSRILVVAQTQAAAKAAAVNFESPENEVHHTGVGGQLYGIRVDEIVFVSDVTFKGKAFDWLYMEALPRVAVS